MTSGLCVLSMIASRAYNNSIRTALEFLRFTERYPESCIGLHRNVIPILRCRKTIQTSLLDCTVISWHMYLLLIILLQLQFFQIGHKVVDLFLHQPQTIPHELTCPTHTLTGRFPVSMEELPRHSGVIVGALVHREHFRKSTGAIPRLLSICISTYGEIHRDDTLKVV